MPYQLGVDEAACQAIVRAVEEQVAVALAQLRGRTDKGRDEAVHTARKAFKKARAGVRLARDGMDGGTYRAIDRSLRDAGRCLAATRDAVVRLETFDALITNAGDLVSPAAYAPVRGALDSERHASAEQMLAQAEAAAAAAEHAEQARVAVAALDLRRGEALLATGLEASYRRARRRCRDAQRSPTTAGLHEWRKRVKDVWYHLRLVQPAWPEVIGPLAGQLRELAQLLGDDHDLAVLRETLAVQTDLFSTPADQLILLDLLDARRAELQSAAFALGRLLHAEKPRPFARRMTGYRAVAPG